MIIAMNSITEGIRGTPEKNVLKIVRDAALWIFAVLFDVSDVETLLGKAILDSAPPAAPIREKALDVAIDAKYGIIEIGEESYYASELLFAVDYVAYRDLGGRLCTQAEESDTTAEGAT